MPSDLFSERILTQCRVSLSFAFAVGFLTFPIFAQPESPSGFPAETTITPADPAGDQPAKMDEFRFNVAWVSTGGSYIYIPEKWGELRINLVNSRDTPRELLCATYFSEQPNLQFGRRVWVPARSTLRVSHPVVIPRVDPAKGRVLNLQSLVLDATEGGDVLVKNNSGQFLHDGALLVTLSPRNTGLIATLDPHHDVPPEEVSEWIIASRISQQLDNKFALLLDTFLPADESELNALDHIVITDNRIADDFAAISAMRHWLHLGGHLWVMLDRADPIVLEKLFGDDFKGHILDRVGLTSIRVDKAPTLSDPDGAIGETIEYEEPVEFVRMTNPNLEVSYRIDGWPAAMSKPYGDGRVFITTLGPRGWMKPRPSKEQQSDNPLLNSEFIPTEQMQNIAAEFFAQREPEILPQTAIEPQVREYVGYTIPSWGLIVGTLIAFSAALVVTAVGLLRSGRLESLGWIGSLLAIAVSVGLLSVGRSYRHGIPGTVATIQVAQAMTGTDDVRTQGVVAAYQPDGNQSPIEVTGGGRMMPDMTGLENSPRRMVMTDLGEWHWENLPQPAGLRTTPFTRAQTVVDRIEARATFDANGIVGAYSGHLPAGTDALIATRDGRLGATLNANGTFAARADDVFEKDQYLSSSLIDDEQDRRRRTLEKLLSNPKRKDYPDRPQLMFWSDQWNHGFRFGDQMKPQGTTLIAVPLILDRPANGTDFVIPSPLLTYRNQTNPDGTPPSTMWNRGRKEWQERSTPGTSWLSVQIPPELLPVRASRAQIEMKVAGPVGRIEVMGLKEKEVVSLETIMDPVGSLSIDIKDTEVLEIAADGTLTLGISAGDPNRPELTQGTDQPPTPGPVGSIKKSDQNLKVNYWRIESLTVQLWVSTTELTVKE